MRKKLKQACARKEPRIDNYLAKKNAHAVIRLKKCIL